jgi:hypothetical protein
VEDIPGEINRKISQAERAKTQKTEGRPIVVFLAGKP